MEPGRTSKSGSGELREIEATDAISCRWWRSRVQMNLAGRNQPTKFLDPSAVQGFRASAGEHSVCRASYHSIDLLDLVRGEKFTDGRLSTPVGLEGPLDQLVDPAVTGCH
jgi:hypothetical protein